MTDETASQEYSDAFNAAASGDPLVFDAPAAETPTAAEEATPAEEATSDEAPVEEVPDSGDTVVAETPASPETPAPEEDAEDIKQVYERLQKIMYGEPPQPEQTPETPETPSTDPKLEEEENQLAAIRKDWPEVDKLIQATIQRTRTEVERQMKAELDRLRQEIEPVAKATQTLSQEQYTSAVLAAHPDTQQILPSMLRWIDKQPDYLKTAYVRAYHSPNPAEAIDLINRYKADAGLKNSQPVVDEKKEEKKHKLKLLQQPGTRRTGVLSQADPADYEGAFAEAAEMLDKAAR